MIRVLEFLILSVVLIASSCNRDEVITTDFPPEIELSTDGGIYQVKVGHELLISLNVKNGEDAHYLWQTSRGEEWTTPSAELRYTSNEIGTVYITLTATSPNGSDSEELRVDILDLERPVIKIINNPATIAVGTSLRIEAQVSQCSIPTTVEWYVDEQKVQDGGTSYHFEGVELGEYTITARAKNDDGEAESSFIVTVISAEDMPLSWEFESLELHTVVGRKLRIRPTEYSKDVSYCWTSDNGTGSSPEFIYTPTYEGAHIVRGTISTIRGGESLSITHEFIVRAYNEDAYLRPATATSVAECSAVVGYTPAPGQFINDTKTSGFDGSELTTEAAIAYAERRLAEGKFVSLGAFGGEIIVAFDHSIVEGEGYDFAVVGNSFDTSSEPGVVWVMQDENGNGKADDTWYELVGSESGLASTIADYEVTYFRPAGDAMSVLWRDNLGNTGEIDYLKEFHPQDSYYPAWITADSYTLRGTRLEARNYDKLGNGTMWIQPPYDWGYADNYSSIDLLDANATGDGEGKPNGFDIANAIDCEGKPIALSHIDFVKVQCAVQAKSGWVGELSTEVFGIYDCRL